MSTNNIKLYRAVNKHFYSATIKLTAFIVQVSVFCGQSVAPVQRLGDVPHFHLRALVL